MPLLGLSSLLSAHLLFGFLDIGGRLGGAFPPFFGWDFFVLAGLFIADGSGWDEILRLWLRTTAFGRQDDGVRVLCGNDKIG